jgi:hypothetical protein
MNILKVLIVVLLLLVEGRNKSTIAKNTGAILRTDMGALRTVVPLSPIATQFTMQFTRNTIIHHTPTFVTFSGFDSTNGNLHAMRMRQLCIDKAVVKD